MSELSRAAAGSESSELGDILLVLVAMIAPVPTIVVLAGPTREVLLSVAIYGGFVLGTLVLTGLILIEDAGSDDHD